MPAPLLELSRHEAHLFVARAPESLPPATARAYEALLSPEEQKRHRALRFERHRHLFLVTRALVRTSLSRYARIAPAAWRFAANEHGKPSVLGPANELALSFNLSNTGGRVVCLIAHGLDVGVDIENTERSGETVSVAEHFFSTREVSDLNLLERARQRERFFAYWTLKEAYIKARGLGLAIPLDQFSFVLRDDSPDIGVVFDPRLEDDPAAWQFARPMISRPYALAVALRRGVSQPDVLLRIEEVEPAC